MTGLRRPIDEADQHRQHVELDVGLPGSGGVGESAAFDHGRREQAAAGHLIPQHMKDGPDPFVFPENRNRIVGFALHWNLEVILIILADAGQVGDDRNAMCRELVRSADPGEQQYLGRRDRTRRQHDLTARLAACSVGEFNGRCAFSFEYDAGNATFGEDRDVAAFLGFPQESPCGAPAALPWRVVV